VSREGAPESVGQAPPTLAGNRDLPAGEESERTYGG